MESFLFIIEVLAVLAFAYSGVVIARQSEFDFVGVLTIALVSAFGGGTLRDVLLDRHPLYWIEHWEFLIYIFVLAAVAALLLRFDKNFSNRKTFIMIDALGLGLFTATGVATALGVGTSILPATLIGVITATFGGVLRDVLCDRKPQLFQPTEPVYATCAFLGAWSYILLYWLGFTHIFGLIVCIAVSFLLRVLAVRYDIKLTF